MKYCVLFALSLLLFVGCEKAGFDYGELEKYDGTQAMVKVNLASLYSNNRGMVIKFNNRRVSPLLLGRTPYPVGGYNTIATGNRADYLMVDPGDLEISLIQPKAIDDGTDSLTLYTTNVQVDAGRTYTVHIADTGALTRSVSTIENFQMPDSGYARYRFINLMPNVPAVDLYYGQNATSVIGERLIAQNIRYMEVGEYFTINRASSRTWKIRPAGADATTTATVLANYTLASTLLNQREYTIFALGYAGATVTAQIPRIAFILTR